MYQKVGMENTLGVVGIVDVMAEKPVKLLGVPGGVMVSVALPENVAVYDIMGRKVTEAYVDGCHTFYLPAGIYMIGGEKVFVK